MRSLVESSKDITGLNIAYNIKNKKDIFIVDKKGDDEMTGNFRPVISQGANIIYGKRGSGKTTYCAFLMESYHELYPKNPIILISSHKKEDEVAFKNFKWLKQLVITSEILDNLNVCEEFKNCLVVIDDPKAFPSKKEVEFVTKMIHDILYNSRKYGVKCIITNHKVLDGTFNKLMTYEGDLFTFFIASKTSWREISVFLDKYLGLDKETIEKIKHTSSRWITISNVVPCYVLSEHKIELL